MEVDTEKDELAEKLKEELRKTFKAPVLIGKIGRIPRKVFQKSSENLQTVSLRYINTDTEEKLKRVVKSLVVEESIPPEQPQEKLVKTAPENQAIPVPYKEPTWTGLPQTPDREYALDILKSGVIIERLDIMSKTYWVFGRSINCDITLAHPTISRHHGVLQFRRDKDEQNEPGFYLYDLGSTHGTFLNKSRLQSRVYARVQVGHIIKFGCSTRSYILDGPVEDTEDESEFSVSELKARRAEELMRREDEARIAKEEKEQRIAEAKRKEEERGVDWGMAEDADSDSDLTINPYAATNNEDLYIDDPKRTLRGYMEREGLQLEYDCSERGPGQFLCKVELPVDDERGKPLVAEVLHKGKKKEAVVQCALEACRLLDRLGVLRQATQESRKRKSKDWAENDYYDSDDDTFLDRTGDVERKRQSRIQKNVPHQPETYKSLLEKESKLSDDINRIETDLARARRESLAEKHASMEEDSLEFYMKELKKEKILDKQMISRFKSELIVLKQEHAKVLKLVNIVRPANLPKLLPQYGQTKDSTSIKKLPMIGKRLKLKMDIPKAQAIPIENDEDDEEETKERSDVMEEEEFEANKFNATNDGQETIVHEGRESKESLEAQHEDKDDKDISKLFHENVFKKANNDSKIFKEFSKIDAEDSTKSMYNERNVGRSWNSSKQIENAFNSSEMTNEATTKESLKSSKDDASKLDKELTSAEIEKRRKKNERRLQQRQEKLENEKQRGYEEDAKKEDYNMWVPPNDQTGDGRTSLNDKFGY